MNARDFTRNDVIERLRREARGSVGPPSSAWDHPASPGVPSRKVATALFGSWREAIRAAGLETTVEAARRRRTERDRAGDAERARRQRESAKPGERKERGVAKWQRERAEKAAREMREDIASGRLRIRRASDADMKRWAEERARRDGTYRPEDAETLSPPGVTPKRRPVPEHEAEEMAAA